MILSFCEALRRDISDVIEARRGVLDTGTPSRDADERLRGEILGMRRTLEILSDLEDRARKADGDDML